MVKHGAWGQALVEEGDRGLGQALAKEGDNDGGPGGRLWLRLVTVMGAWGQALAVVCCTWGLAPALYNVC